MRRATRSELATETVAIVEKRSYRTVAGRSVDLADQVRACLRGTSYHRPEELERLRQEVLSRKEGNKHASIIEVVNETTLAGIARLLARGAGPVAVLNFASARNPGGGFLNGSQAQEESLARSSALYASQLRAFAFYEAHRASSTLMYSDAMIFSPHCPVFRDDEGTLLDEPLVASFITSAAPNAGAAARNRPYELPLIAEVLRRRAEYVLALAAHHGYRDLVLGAWGCGVFRNDPQVVADTFAAHLRRGPWADRFKRVVFSVLDTSPGQATLAAFRKAFEPSEG
jgi:uncharacterized protein (TIGR02452 family)